MTVSRDATPALGALVPAAAVVGGIVSLSVGTSFAKQLFPIVGAEGTITLRVGLSALMLAAVWRPWRLRLGRRDAATILVYGAVLGAMNLAFYMALRTIPFGIAVAIEFAGPLSVATLASRRPVDFLWIGLAALGLSQLLPFGGAGALDPVGLAYTVVSGTLWGVYIVLGQQFGHLHNGRTVALGIAVAALVVAPFGIARAGAVLLDPGVLPLGLGVALLSSALPYSLEMFALGRLRRETFGVLLSVEPAVSALAGLLVLGETLSLRQWIAIGSIVAASVGSTASATLRGD